jgi:hypothetical protein
MPSVEGFDDNVPLRYFGVAGRSDRGIGVRGNSGNIGVWGSGFFGYGVKGESRDRAGVAGSSGNAEGVYGSSQYSYGVRGESQSENAAGVYGYSERSYGVRGESENAAGVYGRSNNSYGVNGISNNWYGVIGSSINRYGVVAYSGTSYGLLASSDAGLAARLEGDVTITGNLTINGNLQKGGGSFKIDHPLDPANKYLSHSFVESPDMKNVYDGVVALDDKGEADIELPDWFGALNKDFRYQLTAIAAPGPNLYIAEEIFDDAATTSNYNNNNSRFKVAGGTSGMKVSWQVTGIRKDPWANAHRIPVEEDKPDKERGYYIYPELYGQPEERGISRLLVPEIEKELPLINK